MDFCFDMLHLIEKTVLSGTWKLLNQERSKKGSYFAHATSISETRASDHRRSVKLYKYESRDHITEQVKRVVPRKGKGVKKKKGKKDKFCITSPLS